MQQMKKSVTARIPQELYDKCNQRYKNMTDAVIDGLELLCKQNCNTDVIANNAMIRDLQNYNETLIKELEGLKKQPENKEIQNMRIQDLQEQIKIKDSQQEARIADLKEQINSLQNQIEVKDKQLMTRDIEVRDLTENLKGQILTIHNLTTKQLPEPKKRWWRIW